MLHSLVSPNKVRAYDRTPRNLRAHGRSKVIVRRMNYGRFNAVMYY